MGYEEASWDTINDTADRVCDVLHALGEEIGFYEYGEIRQEIEEGDAQALGFLAREIAHALYDAQLDARDAAFTDACLAVMALDDIAGKRAQQMAA